MSVFITGGNGFLGQHTMKLFPEAYTLRREIYDLSQPENVSKMFELYKPETIIHLAADVGGIEYNVNNQADIYYNNVLMNTNLIHQAAFCGVKRFIFISSVCIYSDVAYALSPAREHDMWTGLPEESNLSYGVSKRVALIQLESCKKQYEMDYEYLILANLYGAGDKSNHVIPDLIRKFADSPKTIEIWGNGNQSRDFLHVTDAARAIRYFYDNPLGEPVNIANGLTKTIREVVDALSEITGYQGTIVYNHRRLQGQLKRAFNIDKATRHGFETKMKFKDGLKNANYHNDQ